MTEAQYARLVEMLRKQAAERDRADAQVLESLRVAIRERKVTTP